MLRRTLKSERFGYCLVHRNSCTVFRVMKEYQNTLTYYSWPLYMYIYRPCNCTFMKHVGRHCLITQTRLVSAGAYVLKHCICLLRIWHMPMFTNSWPHTSCTRVYNIDKGINMYISQTVHIPNRFIGIQQHRITGMVNIIIFIELYQIWWPDGRAIPRKQLFILPYSF